MVAEMALPKDVISKLVGSLVAAKLLTQVGQASNLRMKRLATTDAGSDLLTRLMAVLTVSLPAAVEVAAPPGFNFDDLV